MMNFIADLSEMFPAGIYDTKYASEFETRFTASYLEYAYKKCKHENGKLMDSSSRHLVVEFCRYPAAMSAYVDYRLCSFPDPAAADPGADAPHICERFSAYGWCPNGAKCAQSHNIDLILQEDEKCKEEKKKRRRKRKKAAAADVQVEMDSEPPTKQSAEEPLPCSEMELEETGMTFSVQRHGDEERAAADGPEKTPAAPSGEAAPLLPDSAPRPSSSSSSSSSEGGTHRAGFDAFMTGYIMAYVWMLKKKSSDSSASCCLPDCVNKVYLSGKNVPLQIVKSVFSKSSRAHVQKMRLISSGGS
ncbi:hypothetical protein GDO78_009043 [Eleutherodactylus coqui]|nr:hypothetical protein GDO78_009043 [Eleutherodactylus coqui]KAG9482869.1 hypothetical protein GDO78_009043 [Eleutherodactylus coqui]